jgi:putative molybdopterin biosynthesis protein
MIREMLTTKEVAEYLSINEKQVYRLIKEHRIPATRITGKWLFPKELVDKWVLESAEQNVAKTARPALANQLVVAGSNDLALELLSQSINARRPRWAMSIANVGSLGGLISLKNGDCHIAASHLLDVETGDYNTSFIRKQFPELKVTIVNLAYREQGLIVRKDNPLRIRTLKDLVASKAVLVNRQEGSGTRVLFDHMLKQAEIRPARIRGYATVAHTHMEAALSVFSGYADIGIGIFAAAKALNLDFVPLATERFDLIVPTQNFESEGVKAMRDVLSSKEFKADMVRMGGYSTQDTGKVMYQRD